MDKQSLSETFSEYIETTVLFTKYTVRGENKEPGKVQLSHHNSQWLVLSNDTVPSIVMIKFEKWFARHNTSNVIYTLNGLKYYLHAIITFNCCPWLCCVKNHLCNFTRENHLHAICQGL